MLSSSWREFGALRCRSEGASQCSGGCLFVSQVALHYLDLQSAQNNGPVSKRVTIGSIGSIILGILEVLVHALQSLLTPVLAFHARFADSFRLDSKADKFRSSVRYVRFPRSRPRVGNLRGEGKAQFVLFLEGHVEQTDVDVLRTSRLKQCLAKEERTSE